MECNSKEKVSLLIDGELSQEEVEQIRNHLASCSVCSRAHSDFLALRRQINAYESLPDPLRRQQAMSSILTAGSPPFWKRKLTLPVPVFAAVCIVVLAVTSWAVFRMTRSQPPPEPHLGVKAGGSVQPRTARDVFDLSRFDHGQRAEIFTAQRPQPDRARP